MHFTPLYCPLVFFALIGCAVYPPVITDVLQVPPAASGDLSSRPGIIHLEAEDAVLTGNAVLTARPGFSGKGYVGDFQPDGAKIVWTIPNAKAGIYEARLRYSAPGGEKGYDLVVNGAKMSGMLTATGDKFATQSAGKVELKDGPNTVEIDRGWGYYDIDALDLTPAVIAATPKPPARLCDPRATPQARALMAALVNLYGAKTLSGQHETEDTAYIRSVTGKTPALLGGDLIEYSPSRLAHGSDPKGETERMIAAAKAGQVVTMLWHWNAPTDLIDKTYTDKNGKSIDAPWWRGFYTDASTFDVQKALADPKSDDYRLLLRDIDAIAVQLQKFSDAGVPVLWRPLHEAQGGWFWWGAKGPGPFKQLWRLMYDRLTDVYHLHNLIWVDCSGLDPAWYPGDDVVDIVGLDAYPSDVTDPLSSAWDTLQAQYGGRKLLALTEFGGVPDVEKMTRYGVHWSYFMSWTGDVGPHKLTPDVLTRLYHAPSVVTQDTLPPSLSNTRP
jgi:mannan endo-1,4-beta-mannosidase